MVSSNNRGVVDHMLSGVGLNMLLDRDLGNMVDLVVDIVSNMVNNRSRRNISIPGFLMFKQGSNILLMSLK